MTPTILSFSEVQTSDCSIAFSSCFSISGWIDLFVIVQLRLILSTPPPPETLPLNSVNPATNLSSVLFHSFPSPLPQNNVGANVCHRAITNQDRISEFQLWFWGRGRGNCETQLNLSLLPGGWLFWHFPNTARGRSNFVSSPVRKTNLFRLQRSVMVRSTSRFTPFARGKIVGKAKEGADRFKIRKEVLTKNGWCHHTKQYLIGCRLATFK